MKNILDIYVASAVIGLPFAVFAIGAIIGSLWAMLLGLGSILIVASAVKVFIK